MIVNKLKKGKLMHKKKLLIAITVIVLLFILIVPLKAPEKVLKIFYPIKYENFVELCAKEYNVDKYLIYAIIKAESNFNEKAVSSKDAKGLMQLMDETAVDISKKMKLNLSNEEISTKLLEADFNIKLGSYYHLKIISSIVFCAKYQNLFIHPFWTIMAVYVFHCLLGFSTI